MDRNTMIRLVMMVLAYVNVLLAAHNYKTIQLDEKTVGILVAIAISAYGFYKNNIFGKKKTDIEKEVVKESEAVIEKVVESQPAPKPEPVVVPVAPSNQPVPPVAPVAQPVPVQPAAPVQENK